LETIILINGKKRAGKDHSASLLKDKLKDSEILSFAGPMKRIISETFGITEDDLDTFKNDTEAYGIEIKVYPNNQVPGVIKYTNFREILQLFGTEAMKPQFGNSVWVDLLLNKIRESDNKIFIVPDFRFLIEESNINRKEFNVITLKIESDNEVTGDGHSSENELNGFNFDYIVDNTKHEKLEEYLESFITQHIKG